ncbi:hypothetical protein DY218_02005 [Streptomyces triticagri]|uniref:Uncharacterized protein n=1 Tax=Streptomyces triticagri TaxID=2293568 RepID=A0A372MBQ4_9ACTN|nr:hypothetical protein [Streptomyces triticagri]RFU88329.1 hypothetical protein DY218_02005 [Streptomyces triticagri]
MGWTHDYSDVVRNRRRSRAASQARPGGGPQGRGESDPGHAVGIPRILRRRARWVSARLRHPR